MMKTVPNLEIFIESNFSKDALNWDFRPKCNLMLSTIVLGQNCKTMNLRKLSTLLLGMVTFGGGVMAQGPTQPKTIHLNAMMQMTAEGQSTYRLTLIPAEDEHYKGAIYDILENLKVEGRYVQRNGQYIEDGHFKFFFPNGQIESEGEFQAGVKVGHWKRFDFQGNQKPDRYYPPSSASARRKSMNIDISTDN
jgi:hypothetical protein